MESSEILKIANTIRDSVNELKERLPSQDFAKINMRVFEEFMQNINSLLNIRTIDINIKNDIMSHNMSFEKMTLIDFKYFYQSSGMSDNEKEKLIGALHGLTNFSFPVLELFPGDGTFTEASVAGEPLYIVDYYPELLEEAASKFNSFYSTRRLMKLVIRDFELTDIPLDQVGLAFCFNYFFVRNIDFIVGWAETVYKTLRPGGYFIFNFI